MADLPWAALASGVPVWLSEDDLSCGICQTLFSCPTTLPCGHSFCGSCIELHWNYRGTKGARRPCPLCREEVHMSPWLRRNTVLQALVDKYAQALKEEPKPCDPSPPHLPELQEPKPMKRKINDVRQELDSMLDQLISGVTSLRYLGPLDETGMSEHLTSPKKLKNNNIIQKNIDEILNDIKELNTKIQKKLIWEEEPNKITNEEPPGTSCSSSLQPSQRQPGPRRSSQLTKWSVLPTFDQRTASHYLELSKNCQKVTVSRQRQIYPPSCERFQNSQVLCSQGFSSGRLYWEVNTQYGSDWAIGVASKNIIAHNHRLGRTADSWCVEWSDTSAELCSWHQKKETVIHKDKPMVVGVWLDLEENQLSFYSVTNEEKLLYKFQLPVPMPMVFPAFWLYGLQPGNSLIINKVPPSAETSDLAQ